MPISVSLHDSTLTQALETIGLGIWEYDHRADRIQFSEALKELLGGDFPGPEGATMAEWFVRIHPEDQERVGLAVRDAVDGNLPFQVEYRFRRADGHWQWVRARGAVMERDAAGNPLRSLGSKVDISDRKRQEHMLQLQHAFTKILAQAPDRETLFDAILDTVLGLPEFDGGALYRLRAEGGFQMVRHRGITAALAEYARTAEAGTPHFELIQTGRRICSCSNAEGHCDDPGLVRHPLLEQEGIQSLVVLPILARGQVIACLNLISKRLATLPEDVVLHLDNLQLQVGQALERLQARENADEEKQNLEGFFKAIADFVFIMDTEGRILQINPAVHTLGYDDSLVGQSVLAVHPSRVRE